jgi:hypothetical protein
MEHTYKIPSLTIVAERQGFEQVVCSAVVYLTTTETFDVTVDGIHIDEETGESVIVPTVQPKIVSHFKQFNVEFDTSDITENSFTKWEDLTEEQVLEWVISIKGDELLVFEQEGAASVADQKDRILNPKRYQFDSPPTPWQIRADKESAEQN